MNMINLKGNFRTKQVWLNSNITKLDIKIGSVYRSDALDLWCLVKKRNKNGLYECYVLEYIDNIYVEYYNYLSPYDIEEDVDLEHWYVPVYTRWRGLMAVWDGVDKNSVIILKDTSDTRKYLNKLFSGSKGQCMMISDNKGCYIYFNKDKNNTWFIKDKITNERFVEMIVKVIGNTIELETTIIKRSDSVMVE